MGTRRKVGQRRRENVNTLSRDMCYALVAGRSYFGPLIGGDYPVETLRIAWQKHAGDIKEACLEAFPGCRCFAEWMFELVPKYGERRVVDGRLKPEHRQNWLRYGILHTHVMPRFQESETAYLLRNGLLTPAEMKMHRQGELADPVPDQFGITPADYSVWATDELLDELAGGDDE
jgi:hypothetical protein